MEVVHAVLTLHTISPLIVNSCVQVAPDILAEFDVLLLDLVAELD
jgi:hypothetical protein